LFRAFFDCSRRFYGQQPELDTQPPAVRHEITTGQELRISAFRTNAVPFIMARKGVAVPTERDHGFVHELRPFLPWRCRDDIMLAEANAPPDEEHGSSVRKVTACGSC